MSIAHLHTFRQATFVTDSAKVRRFSTVCVTGRWEWEYTPDLNSLIRIWPSYWSYELANGRRKLLEAHSEPDVPTTGEKLREWHESTKMISDHDAFIDGGCYI